VFYRNYLLQELGKYDTLPAKGVIQMRQTKNQKDTKTADLNVAVEEQVKRKVKALAADEGKTLPEMVNDLLKLALSIQTAGAGR
jgi:hypothetical protein